jgi:uncharacterized membrane protein YheB (UPF0754 family)
MKSIAIVLIAALIGWITNFIAIRMLFRPRKKIGAGIFSFHGLIPRRQKEIARSVGETFAQELINHEDITKVLKEPEVQVKIQSLVASEVDNFILKASGANPMFAMFLQGEMLAQVKRILFEQLESQMPKIVEHLIETLESKVDFAEIVEQRISTLELDRLENLIHRVASKELKTIEILGGVLGALVGLIQVALI